MSITVFADLAPLASRASRTVGLTLGRWLQPDLSSPTVPLATVAWLDAYTPSLMPRTTVLQGVMAGVSVLASRTVTRRVEDVLAPLLGSADDPLTRLGLRALVGAVGTGMSVIPERTGEPAQVTAVRGAGTVLRSIAAGGILHDLGRMAWRQQDRWLPRDHSAAAVPTIVAGASVATGLVIWAQRRGRQHVEAVEPWPIEQRYNVPASAAISGVVVVGGRLLQEASTLTGAALRRWLGPGPGKGVFATALNAGLWGAAATATYLRGAAQVGQGNFNLEPSYARPPSSRHVSGGPRSSVPFNELGKQGRRFVHEAMTREMIAEVMGEGAADPIRVYVGFASQPLYPTSRAEQALEELERMGAYERSHLLLVSPTGTGWVDEAAIESAELFARGDIATCSIQYGMFPSFLALQKVALGRSQFRILLLGVRERLRGIPPHRRPKVLVFGESLGAWTASDVVMHSGVAGFDAYGIDRALWVGMPQMARWSATERANGHVRQSPGGELLAIDRAEDLAGLTDQQRRNLRAVMLAHDNDPIARLSPGLLIQPPPWLQTEQRGRGVPDDMRWTPMVTFIQTAVDALNSFVQVPGEFTSHGHDYRADMARAVHVALDLPPVSGEQMAAVETTLVERDLAQAARLQPRRLLPHLPPPAPIHTSRPD